MALLNTFDGRFLHRDEQTYRILGQDHESMSVVLESEFGKRFLLPYSDFRLHVANGDVSEGSQPEFGTKFLASAARNEEDFRRKVLDLIHQLRREGKTWNSAVEEAKKEICKDPRHAWRANKFPKVRTIQKWDERRRKRDPMAFRDGRENSGNRNPRHDLLFETIVFDLLERDFLTSDRATVTSLVSNAATLYLNECRKAGKKPMDHGRRIVEGLIETIPHDDVVKLRLDSDSARERLRQSARFFDIKLPFDRVEVDSTEADIFVYVDAIDELVRPWITVAIDAATGWIIGMVVSISRPTALTTIETLVQAMQPTEEAFFDRFGIENRFQAFGNLLVIVADQGSENKGDLIRRLVSLTPTEFQLRRPKNPEGKPFVESLNNTMKHFITQLSGATQTKEMPAKIRTDRAKSEAVYSFDQFVCKLQKWRYDVYAVTPRRRIHNLFRLRESPLASWRRLEGEAFLPEPPRKQDLRELLFCKSETRRLHHYGIEYERTQYWSKELSNLRIKRDITEVEIWINRADIREIAVTDPDSGEAIFVAAKDPQMPAINFDELARIREKIGDPGGAPLRAQEILAELVHGNHHAPRKARTKQRKVVEEARRRRRDKEIKEKCQRRREIRPRGGAKVGQSGRDRRLGKRAPHIAGGCQGALVRKDQIRSWFRSSAGPCSGRADSCRHSSPEC